MDESSLS